ncbi:hypothetical protein [Hymenobacter siberiensis]|uniref:hypothetical protein n=1 Tax=Hymenobacter siberiensis TaxID=2848396 RepID=UPI001C1E7273|nr:hypothetical protein [Hymenobacter siberiensis]
MKIIICILAYFTIMFAISYKAQASDVPKHGHSRRYYAKRYAKAVAKRSSGKRYTYKPATRY